MGGSGHYLFFSGCARHNRPPPPHVAAMGDPGQLDLAGEAGGHRRSSTLGMCAGAHALLGAQPRTAPGSQHGGCCKLWRLRGAKHRLLYPDRTLAPYRARVARPDVGCAGGGAEKHDHRHWQCPPLRGTSGGSSPVLAPNADAGGTER